MCATCAASTCAQTTCGCVQALETAYTRVLARQLEGQGIMVNACWCTPRRAALAALASPLPAAAGAPRSARWRSACATTATLGPTHIVIGVNISLCSTPPPPHLLLTRPPCPAPAPSHPTPCPQPRLVRDGHEQLARPQAGRPGRRHARVAGHAAAAGRGGRGAGHGRLLERQAAAVVLSFCAGCRSNAWCGRSAAPFYL